MMLSVLLQLSKNMPGMDEVPTVLGIERKRSKKTTQPYTTQNFFFLTDPKTL